MGILVHSTDGPVVCLRVVNAVVDARPSNCRGVVRATCQSLLADECDRSPTLRGTIQGFIPGPGICSKVGPSVCAWVDKKVRTAEAAGHRRRFSPPSTPLSHRSIKLQV